jgi:hypothetical protein
VRAGDEVGIREGKEAALAAILRDGIDGAVIPIVDPEEAELGSGEVGSAVRSNGALEAGEVGGLRFRGIFVGHEPTVADLAPARALSAADLVIGSNDAEGWEHI